MTTRPPRPPRPPWRTAAPARRATVPTGRATVPAGRAGRGRAGTGRARAVAPGGGRRWSAFVGRVAVLLVLAACDDATGPAAPEEVVFAVEGEAFEIDPFEGVAVVPFTVRNPTAEAVYLNGCPPSPAPWADRREGGRWNRFSTYPCGAVTDVELAPGATVSGSYEIGEPGEYRLGLAVRAEAQGAESWLHITPPFEVR